jgi:hypothetical protein
MGVPNQGPKLGSQIGVPNRGHKSGSQIGVPNRGPKSGSQIGVPNRGPNTGSQIGVLKVTKVRIPVDFHSSALDIVVRHIIQQKLRLVMGHRPFLLPASCDAGKNICKLFFCTSNTLPDHLLCCGSQNSGIANSRITNSRITNSRISYSRIVNSRIANSRKAIPDPMLCSNFTT